MSTSTSYYEILGVARDADGAALKKAYRKLAMRYHPDKNQGNPDAADMFKRVSQAYETLSDPEKRSVYNRYGEEGVQQMEGGGGGPVDPSEIFARMFGGGFGGFGGGFGGRAQRGFRKPKSRTQVNIDLRTLVQGGEVPVQFTDTVAKNLTTGETCTTFNCCDTCQGTGVMMVTHQLAPGMFQQAQGACRACEGRGYTLHPSVADDCIWMDELKSYTAHVPAGASLQEPLVLFDKGKYYVNPETQQVQRCDLYVVVQCEPVDDDVPPPLAHGKAAPPPPTNEWRLYSPQHRHLLWTPTLQVVYGLVTNRLRCTHPNGSEYVLQMPSTHRTETMVATGLGLPATDKEPCGDLFIRVLWDFDTTVLARAPWFQQMCSGMRQRAPWTNEATHAADATCLTTDQYETYQMHSSGAGGGASYDDSDDPSAGGHGRRPQRVHVSSMGGEEGGVQECVQS